MTAAMMGTSKQGHFAEIDGDGFGDVPFLGADAGISARGVNQGNDGQAEFVGQTHQAQCLAITFRMRGTEIAQDVFLRVAALLGADDDDPMLSQSGKTADHRAVFRKEAVAVQLAKIREGVIEVIQRVRAFGMPCQLHALPGGQIRENLAPGFFQLFFDELDFLLKADVQRMLFRVFVEGRRACFAVR